MALQKKAGLAALHSSHLFCALSSWYLPGVHPLQEDRPSSLWNSPGSHDEQLDLPAAELYVPLAHIVHCALDSAAAAQPVGQAVQEDLPASAWNSPSAHASASTMPALGHAWPGFIATDENAIIATLANTTTRGPCALLESMECHNGSTGPQGTSVLCLARYQMSSNRRSPLRTPPGSTVRTRRSRG